MDFTDRQIIEDIRGIAKTYLHETKSSVSTRKKKENGVLKKYYSINIPIRDMSLCSKFFEELSDYSDMLIANDIIHSSFINDCTLSNSINDWFCELYKYSEGNESNLFCLVSFHYEQWECREEGSNEKIDRILRGMYESIINNVSVKLYSFKGGFILQDLVNSSKNYKGVRRTKDIDLSVVNEEAFNKIKDIVFSYLEVLRDAGEISGYKSKVPKSTETSRRSGSIDVYDEDSRVLCGVDISYHSLDYGVVKVNDGSFRYSNERMLADKFCVMYSDEYTLTRRIRDVLDIYLINTCIFIEGNSSLDYKLLVDCINNVIFERNLVFSEVSTLEMLMITNMDYLLMKFNSLVGDDKVSKKFFNEEDSVKIIEWVVTFINKVRVMI